MGRTVRWILSWSLMKEVSFREGLKILAQAGEKRATRSIHFPSKARSRRPQRNCQNVQNAFRNTIGIKRMAEREAETRRIAWGEG